MSYDGLCGVFSSRRWTSPKEIRSIKFYIFIAYLVIVFLILYTCMILLSKGNAFPWTNAYACTRDRRCKVFLDFNRSSLISVIGPEIVRSQNTRTMHIQMQRCHENKDIVRYPSFCPQNGHFDLRTVCFRGESKSSKLRYGEELDTPHDVSSKIKMLLPPGHPFLSLIDFTILCTERHVFSMRTSSGSSPLHYSSIHKLGDFVSACFVVLVIAISYLRPKRGSRSANASHKFSDRDYLSFRNRSCVKINIETTELEFLNSNFILHRHSRSFAYIALVFELSRDTDWSKKE